jgi:hypothetical protein
MIKLTLATMLSICSAQALLASSPADPIRSSDETPFHQLNLYQPYGFKGFDSGDPGSEEDQNTMTSVSSSREEEEEPKLEEQGYAQLVIKAKTQFGFSLNALQKDYDAFLKSCSSRTLDQFNTQFTFVKAIGRGPHSLLNEDAEVQEQLNLWIAKCQGKGLLESMLEKLDASYQIFKEDPSDQGIESITKCFAFIEAQAKALADAGISSQVAQWRAYLERKEVIKRITRKSPAEFSYLPQALRDRLSSSAETGGNGSKSAVRPSKSSSNIK